jgi:hypothetical protein
MPNVSKRTHGRAKTCLLAAATLGATVASTAGVAQENSARRERASIMLGTFLTDRDTSARLDSNAGSGSDIDLEDDLGLEGSTTVARLGGHWWINERHRFDGGYFDLSRDASKRIEETIEFGDETFTVDTVLTINSDLTVVKVDYTYAVLARDRGYLGITGGLYVSQTTLELSVANLSAREEQDVTAPLPVIGLRGDYAINDHITLRGAAQIFDYSVDNVGGRLTDFYVGADYGIGDHWAVGLAWNKVAMSLTAETDRGGLEGSLDWGYDGLLLYAKFDLGQRR